MSRALESALTSPKAYLGWRWGANMCPTNAEDICQSPKTARLFSYFQENLLPSSFRPKTGIKVQLEPFNDVTPLLNLIAELKRNTESRLERTITRVTVSYPSFFHEDLITHLEHALHNLSLSEDGCHGDARSSVAALIAYRQAETNPKHSMRPLDCIHGPFGLENVVHIENTERYLALTAFEFFAGENSSWTRRSFRQPTFLKKDWDSTKGNGTEDDDASMSSATLQEDFWVSAQVCFQDYFAAQYKSNTETIYRFILTGSQFHDPHLLQALRNARGVGELIPSPSPIALHIHRNAAEISRKYVERRSGLTCLLEDYSTDWGLWYNYGQDLLDSILKESRNFTRLIDPRFAAARGAALYSLESRLVPCTGECNMTECYERRPRKSENDFVLERHRKEDSAEKTLAEL